MTDDSGPSRTASAGAVAAGILCSRATGFLRDVVLAAVFGAGAHADVFATALRGPNILQNLLGDQTLSVSFIPVYSRLLRDGRREEAQRFAGAIFGLLFCLVVGLVAVGVLLAKPIVTVLAPGFLGDAAAVAAGTLAVDRFALTVRAVRIIFPMIGLFVFSAWSLGVLNSHRRFFLPYFAPVLWNAAMIAAVGIAVGGLTVGRLDLADREAVLIAACLGGLVGAALQFGVQLPTVLRSLGSFRPRVSLAAPGVREALSAFGPLLVGRGAVQLSGYISLFLASFLAVGAVGAVRYAQLLYLLPVSLFAMSVAAAALPELSRAGTDEGERFVDRLASDLREIGFLVIPTAIGYCAFGSWIVAAVFRRGSFGVVDNLLVYALLATYSLGLLASSASRILQNAFFAVGETRLPARVGIERVVLSTLVALATMFRLDEIAVPADGVASGVLFFGAVGLALGNTVGAWYELVRLARGVRLRLPTLRLPASGWGSMALAAGAACLPTTVVTRYLGEVPGVVAGVAVVLAYAVSYFGIGLVVRLPEAESWLARIRRVGGRS